MFLGLSTLTWAVVLAALWVVTAVLAAVWLVRSMKLADSLESERNDRMLTENDLRKLREQPPPSPPPAPLSDQPLGPRGRHHEDTSQIPVVRADLAEAVSTGPMPAVPGAWNPDMHPGRRIDDAPTEALRPPRPGGRRRSDDRQTRATARRLRDGTDDVTD